MAEARSEELEAQLVQRNARITEELQQMQRDRLAAEEEHEREKMTAEQARERDRLAAEQAREQDKLAAEKARSDMMRQIADMTDSHSTAGTKTTHSHTHHTAPRHHGTTAPHFADGLHPTSFT